MASDADTQSVRPIITLPKDVVQKIAAGEVVVRPLNAVKELIENSIDAGATVITVTCKNGGLDLIKVKDNGCGIDVADYERVCERFATSKLKTAADLQKISTFGFRGEALASISCMAKVQIISHTKDSDHAWTANYRNCVPIGKPTASAGLLGTQIAAANLFEDYPQRRSVFTRTNEEAVGIANVLIKYAINFPHIKFAFVRDDGSKRTGGSFSSLGNGDQHAVIRLLMPPNLVKNLFDFDVQSDKYKFSAKICMASPLSSHTSTAIKAKNDKQKIFQLFINNRLVTSNKLKQTVDMAFSTHDAYCPFINIAMQIEPSRIDVNIHPTKEMVCFLDEAQIIDCIETKLFEILDTFRQQGAVDMNSIGFVSSNRRSSIGSVSTSRNDSINSNKPIMPCHSSGDDSTIKDISVPIRKPILFNQTSTRNLALDMRQANDTPQKPFVLYEHPSTSAEISPIKGNRSSFDFAQKRRLDTSTDSMDRNSNIKPKVARQTVNENASNSGSKYKFDMSQAFSKVYTSPSTTVRVDATNHSITEYLAPNTTLQDHDLSYQSLAPGDLSVYSKTPNTTLQDQDRSYQSLAPGDLSAYSKTPNTTVHEASHQSLLPGDLSLYSEPANDSLADISMRSDVDLEEILNNTVGDPPNDRGKHVFKALAEAQNSSSIYLTSIVRRFVFVGYVDALHAIFQSENSIFMVDLMPLLEEVFYQKCLRSVGRQNGRRIMLNTAEMPDGMPLLSLVDTYLSICPSAQLPNENQFDTKEDAAEDLIAKFYRPEVVELLWDFGISIVLDEQRGPLLNAIVSQLDAYNLLLSQQLAKFGYELACVNWESAEVLGTQIARAVARLHTPYQIANCPKEAANEQSEMIKNRLVSFVKSDFFVPEKLKPHFKKLLSTVEAYKIFGRC